MFKQYFCHYGNLLFTVTYQSAKCNWLEIVVFSLPFVCIFVLSFSWWLGKWFLTLSLLFTWKIVGGKLFQKRNRQKCKAWIIHQTQSSKPLEHIQLIRFDVSISANYIYDDKECHIDHPLNGYLPCGSASTTLLRL